jgi:hypothetical protein
MLQFRNSMLARNVDEKMPIMPMPSPMMRKNNLLPISTPS